MDNYRVEIVNNRLVVTCDISPKMIADARPSATGKSKIVCGTGGFIRVSPELSLSLNLITK